MIAYPNDSQPLHCTHRGSTRNRICDESWPPIQPKTPRGQPAGRIPPPPLTGLSISALKRAHGRISDYSRQTVRLT